jgi:hypothetical protein
VTAERPNARLALVIVRSTTLFYARLSIPERSRRRAVVATMMIVDWQKAKEFVEKGPEVYTNVRTFQPNPMSRGLYEWETSRLRSWSRGCDD